MDATPSVPLTGVLTQAGDLRLEHGTERGLVISMTREELRAVASLPMYQRVCVVSAAQQLLAGDREAYHAALAEINRLRELNADMHRTVAGYLAGDSNEWNHWQHYHAKRLQANV